MFVSVETKKDVNILINTRNISMIRAYLVDDMPTITIYFCGDEAITLSKNPNHENYVSVIELDDLLEQITGNKGRY